MDDLNRLKDNYLRDRDNEATMLAFFYCLGDFLKKILAKRSYLLSKIEEDEIIQFTMIKLNEHLHSIKDLPPYARVVMDNKFRKLVTKRKKADLYLEEGNHSKSATTSDEDEFKISIRELKPAVRRELMDVVAKLKPPKDYFVEARFFRGLSYKEISDEKGIKFASVGKTVSRSLAAFVKSLKKDHEDLYNKLAVHFDREPLNEEVKDEHR